MIIQYSEDRTIQSITDNETVSLEKYHKMDSINKVVIANEKEPEEKIILCLTFIDKTSKETLSNQRVSFYHSSTDGEYEPSNPNDEITARLNGTAITDEDGKIFIKTILPGDYGGADKRHIHTTVYGAHPEPYDIFFNQYSGRIGKFMNSGNEQMFYAELKKTADDMLVCFVTIEAKNPKILD